MDLLHADAKIRYVKGHWTPYSKIQMKVIRCKGENIWQIMKIQEINRHIT